MWRLCAAAMGGGGHVTKQEVNKLLALMKANYSYAFKTMSQQDKYLLLNTWTFTLQDLNADVVMIAAMQLISVSKWLPTVAEIREQCRELHYSAAYGNDSVTEWLIEEGKLPQAEVEAYNRKRQAQRYIANATEHLRGDKPATLKLDSILRNPAFTGIGAGKSSFDMLGEAQLELPNGGKEDEYEQGYPDRQSGR